MPVPNLMCSILMPAIFCFIIFVTPTDNNFANTLNAEKVARQPISDTTVYMVVQVPPEFPGGNLGMFRFIQSTSKYPVSSARNKTSQTVFIKLLVEKDGSISKVTVPFSKERGEIEEEAERIGKEMPKWKPGSQNGHALRVFIIIPIHFHSYKKQ